MMAGFMYHNDPSIKDFDTLMTEFEKFKALSSKINDVTDLIQKLKKDNHEIKSNYEELQHKSTLFLIGSNKSFTKKMKEIFRMPKKSRIKAAILWIDVDNMGKLNNTFGHDVANAIIDIIRREIISQCKEFNESNESDSDIDSNCSDDDQDSKADHSDLSTKTNNEIAQCIPYKPHDQGMIIA